MPRLRRSNCAAPGISRRRRGRRFEYLDPDARRIDDPGGARADRGASDPAGVAAYLGNTPAVCRASYVDPRVIDRFQAGVTIAGAIGRAGPDLGRPRVRAGVERAVLELLEDAVEDG
jgi:DNA topoisomerase IB